MKHLLVKRFLYLCTKILYYLKGWTLLGKCPDTTFRIFCLPVQYWLIDAHGGHWVGTCCGWRVTLWLSHLVHFFWVWNKITEVESGFKKLEEPSNGRAFDSCFFPALWQWQNADKIHELDEMKQPIRVPCHLGRWWLKMASLTGSPGVLSGVMLKVIVQRGLGWLLGQLRTSRAARECLWKQHSPSSH